MNVKEYHVDALIMYLGQHLVHLKKQLKESKHTSRIQREIQLWKKVRQFAKQIHRLYVSDK